MPNFAVIDGESVVNTIVVDSQAIAEEVTGKTCIEFTTENAEPGGTYSDGVFTKRKPYPSWVFDENFNDWKPSVPFPGSQISEDGETLIVPQWDEETLSWVIL